MSLRTSGMPPAGPTGAAARASAGWMSQAPAGRAAASGAAAAAVPRPTGRSARVVCSNAFEYLKVGYAAMSFALFAFIGLVTFANARILRYDTMC